MNFSASFLDELAFLSSQFVVSREPRMPSKDSDFSGYWSDKPS